MDYRSDRLSSHHDGVRLSTSLSGQRLSQLTPSHSCPVVETVGPSHQASPYRYGLALDDSARAYRTTALRQVNGNHRPLSWMNRQANHSGNRSSTLASQPVLVRPYTESTDDTGGTSGMPSRRSFPFSVRSGTPKRGPNLPSEEDFSIDGILRAIEPEIRSTLDTIGEICGRSKLSLANEYGSHIAPLGEIRAPPSGLLTVEEASSDHERQADDTVIIFDDDSNSVIGVRDYTTMPQYRYLEQTGPSTVTSSTMVYQSFVPFSVAEGLSVLAQPDTPRSPLPANLDENTSGLVADSLPATREFMSKPNSNGRTLLGRQNERITEDQIRSILTPALVSEILLDAQANGHSLHSLPSDRQDQLSPGEHGDTTTRDRGQSDKQSVLTDVQALFNWLRNASQDGQPRSAEKLLRAMLERQNEQHPTNTD
ncbi:hypothetical protein CNMCM5793_004517 [Aspergillus hiratsukae]|uniref:Uncharacterized protein n=1 Tax=Aspergillus hiratsukae TaxID=1194566 RepID=A0A8H6UCF0_9EURO|nr:hypothetical protein CNMCM5793_004517 [Aspergillus hiratsukae]KAF7163422.1 hypothetical protein CNMCM6106_000372 [Aspergillus hiratsukae]